jgi:outer membrane protein W
MNVIQDISYIEIPLEAKYKFLNSKIGINAIFGINYSLLDKNEVSIKTEKGFSTLIGKTSNLLSQTFGANIGLGFDYKLSKKIKLNIEPMLKYQLRNNQEGTKNNSFNFNILTGIEFNIFDNK